jgi:DNA-binding NarL/FixJ family response regulator
MMTDTADKTGATQLHILIAEDHEFTRTGLKYSLMDKSTFKVVAEAENGEQAVALAHEKEPHIVLMDIGMPIMDGITATQHIKQAAPGIKVVMLTSRQVGEEVYAALAAGADAYCMKDISTERLVQVMHMVAEGGIWLDPPVAQLLMTNLPTPGSGNETRGSQTRQAYNTELTDREMDVLKLIVRGRSNKEIADALTITTHTVKVHVGNIIQKLAVDDRTQAAVKAIQDGLVDSPGSQATQLYD